MFQKNFIFGGTLKVHSPSKVEELRKISGLENLSKYMEKVIAEFLIEDMKLRRDKAQYVNEKKKKCLYSII